MNALEQAAFDYAEATLHAESAESCGMPKRFVAQLSEIAEKHMAALRDASIAHFHNVYDGAN